jgi:diaminopropionate ammonia-lyase
VIEGYATILEEVDEQLAGAGVESLDAVFVPVGVGAFAAAVAGHYRRGGAEQPLLVGAEPVDAACVLESAQAGGLVTLAAPQRSIMAGLNCGTPSSVAWPAVSRGFDFFQTVTDGQALAAMRTLAKVGIRAGESGAASLAALVNLASHPESPLSPRSTVVLISTEGVTDPEFYEREVIHGGE